MPRKPDDFPSFHFYPKDWLTGQTTQAMTPEQRGAFIQLLAQAWERSPRCTLPNDDTQLATLSGLGARWKKSGALVRSKFESVPDHPELLRNAKLWSVFENMVALRLKRQKARYGDDNDADLFEQNNPSSLSIYETETESESSTQEETRKPRKRAIPLPPDFSTDETHARIAAERMLSLSDELASMRDWAASKGVTRIDWPATFRNWLRNSKNGRIAPKTAANYTPIRKAE